MSLIKKIIWKESNITKATKMTEITTYLSTITLNINDFNSPIKRHRLIEWIKKYDPILCCLQEMHSLAINTGLK
jgi:hypothetical protein